MPREREHPVPTERRVLISDLDRRFSRRPLEAMLRDRGFDLTLAYREEPQPDGTGTLYVQDIPQEETA